MMRFLVRRLGHAGCVLLGVSVLAFAFSTLAPGNYFDEMRLNPQISAERLSALRADYQVDRPMALRYARWAAALLPGALGFSFAYNTPVPPLLLLRPRNPPLLTVTSPLLLWVLSLPLATGPAPPLCH